MTTKQTATLLLFAQDYSIVAIACKQKVSQSTIRERIKALSKSHPDEFDNAVSLREAYKNTREAIKNVKYRNVRPTDEIKKIF